MRVAAVNATGDGAWSANATAKPVDVTLTATNIRQTTATLTIGGYTKAWWYKEGSGDCESVSANTASVNLTGLTAETEYTFRAFSLSSCATSAKIAEHTFTTLDPVTLTASNIEAKTAKLTIANFTEAWWYKKTSPSAGSCTSVDADTASVDVSGLTPGANHTFKAYSNNNCSTELPPHRPS